MFGRSASQVIPFDSVDCNDFGLVATPSVQSTLLTVRQLLINPHFTHHRSSEPLLLEDENGVEHGNDWARGFMRGTQWC
jgi:hypothetical protein